MAQLDACLTEDQEVVGSTPVIIDHEIFSVVILSLPLIQEGHLSVLAKEHAHYWLTA